MAPLRVLAALAATAHMFSDARIAGGSITYTPVGGIFNTTDFNMWLQSSASAGYDQLILAPGTYTAPSPTQATQNAHVFLPGPISNVLVDMTGVTIVMSSRADTAVLVTGWVNVTLRGLTSLYATLPSNQATILSISPDGFAYDVQVPTGYPLQDWAAGAQLSCNVFDRDLRVWKAGTWDLYVSVLTPLNGTNMYRMNFTSAYGPAQMNVAAGDLLGCRTSSFAFTFHVSGTENCTYEDITLLGGPGFGYFAEGTNAVGSRGGNTYRRCSIRLPPTPAGATESPLIATSADGFHMAGVPWGPLIDSCYFERMTDDGIAIHGSFHIITGLNASSNSVWIVASDFTVGDTLRVYDTTFAPAGTFTIAAVAAAAPSYVPPFNTSHTMPSQKLPGAKFQVLTLVEALPANITFDFIASDANRTGNGFVITNTSVMWHRARGMLIKASEGTITGNHVMGSTMGALIITPELYWGEADYAHNLWVEGNTFEYVGYGKQSYGGVALGALDPDNTFATAGGHTNITFINNTWRNISYTNLWVTSAVGVTLINNTFDVPFVSPQYAFCCEPVPTNVVVYASNTDNITIAGNCVYSPGSNGGILNVTSTVTGTGLTNGVVGFRPNDGSPTQTAFPCQLANVATFDVDMMHAFGQAMGEEFAGKGSNVALCPMIILARVPQGGRTFESIGEDPELAYAMAFAHITGLQTVPGVMANADDFVLNNAELDRTTISAVADERTRFELYYRGYAGAVDAGVASFMCSYNQVNGTHACENAVTLGDLKSPAGLNFTGWVLSDWGGTHSTVASALAGLDQEMPSSDYFGDALLAAVQDGSVPMSVIDDKVLRILTPMFAAGLFDLPPCPASECNPDSNVTSVAHTALARGIAAASTVLLSNVNGSLPLDDSITSMVVVGDGCDLAPQCCGAGSGALFPPYVVTPLQGLTARAGAGVNVTYFPTPVGAAAITQWFSPGRGDHFLDFLCNECPSGPDAYNALRVEAYVASLAFPGSVELALYYNSVNMSNLIAPAVGYTPPSGYDYIRPSSYALPLNYSGPGVTAVLELWSGMDTPTGAPPNSHLDFFTLATNASRAEAIAAGYTKVMDLARVFVAPTAPDYAAVAAAAAAADVAIVCATTPSSEGSDRPDLNLTDTDNAMIAAVAAAQPRTVVTLNIPGAVIMPWADAVGAIVCAWYPGQEMGNALADVLWGDVNPSGRLPLTFAKSNADTPLQTPQQYPGVNGIMNYTEELLIGYRWWDANGVEPLFPFGHGLSYTTFAYSALDITPAVSDGSSDIVINFNVTNSGAVPGREVPQLYMAYPQGVGEPPRVLRAFSAVDLLPGETVAVTYTLTPRDVSFWDVNSYAWAVVPGGFTAFVGASSRDFRLQGGFNITAGNAAAAVSTA